MDDFHAWRQWGAVCACSAPHSRRQGLFLTFSSAHFWNVSNLNCWMLPSRFPGNDAHAAIAEAHWGPRRTAGHHYLVPQVGDGCDPGRAADGCGQLLEICHHTVAAWVERDRDVHSVCRLQVPAQHIHKLERGREARDGNVLVVASLVMGAWYTTESSTGSLLASEASFMRLLLHLPSRARAPSDPLPLGVPGRQWPHMCGIYLCNPAHIIVLDI